MADGRGSPLKRIFGWLIFLPVLAGAIAFALHNRSALTVSLWPSEYILTYPVYAVVFAAILSGFFLGGVFAWIGFGRKRALLRKRTREIERLKAEIAELKRGATAPAKPTEAEAAETARRQLVAAQS